jgi:hypothetical protein
MIATAASAAASPGLIERLVMHGTRLYALVAGQGKGVQVIDVPTALDLFAQAANGEEAGPYRDVVQSISVQGRGFGETSIVQAVFLDTARTRPSDSRRGRTG